MYYKVLVLIFSITVLTACLSSSLPETQPATDVINMTPAAKVTKEPHGGTPTSSPDPRTLETPRPTLSVSASEEVLGKLVKENLGCRLPCIWGIQPGATYFNVAKNFFEEFAGPGAISFSGYENSFDLQDFSLGLYVGIYPSNGVIEKMHIVFSGEKLLNNIEYFSFVNILRELGEPATVLISLFPGTHVPEQALYEVLLYYPQDNVLVQFYGRAKKVENTYRLCPKTPNLDSYVNSANGMISLYIGTPGQDNFPEELVRPFWHLPKIYLPIEEALEINTKEFYEQSIEEDHNACFFSPVEAWPSD